MDNQPQAGAPAGGAAAAPAAQPASTLPTVPDSWPGAFGLFKHSKQAVKVNLVTLVVLWLIFFLISLVLDFILKTAGPFISILVDSLGSVAFVFVYLAGIRGEHMSAGQALSKALPLWVKMILLNLLVAISVVGSALLLVVPFFFVMPRLVLANYFLVDQNMGVMEAYKASWAATKGHSGSVWGVIGASILMALVAVTIIGIPVAIYLLIMYSAAYAILYKFLANSQPAKAPAAAPSGGPAQTPPPTPGMPPASTPA